jgi:transcriptional antiterminator RfaH
VEVMRAVNNSERPCWYAVYTKPCEEVRAESNLRAWAVETFAPTMRARRINNFTGKSTSVIKPLFPRYVFARFDAERMLHKISYTRGVHSIVSFGEGPLTVDDEIIELIQSQRGADGHIRIGEELKAGDKVMIERGPLKNFIGVFDGNLKDPERISILLSTVNYQNRVVLERDAVRKVA